jgi:hypothetical protein
MHGVLLTPTFERQMHAVGLSESELTDIVSWLAENPLGGDLVPGTGGARKVRFAKPGKGKSGGYRTIHYFGGNDIPIFLLAILSKGQRADLSQDERNALARTLPGVAAAYRVNPKRR